MCRSIQPLFNFDPPATEEDIRAAALQYVRKISGYTHPSKGNEAAFFNAVEAVTTATATLLETLETTTQPRSRAVYAARARARSSRINLKPKEG